LTDAGVRDAVVAHLVKRPTPPNDRGQPGGRGWTSSTRYGGGPGADPATIEFVKSNSFPTCQLHSVSFTNHKGWAMHVLIKTWQGEGGTWNVHPCGGGAGPHPHRSQPWVNFTAGFSAESFAGGGWVVGDGSQHASSVRLAFANDIVVEDTVDNGVVLFFEPHRVVAPAEVAVIDRNGGVLVTYMEFVDFA
jgi:hypothetical protein